ncbi:MAG: hypothetical protein LBS50_09520 [Prevotellaceae bacterium]|nr:hypothetical protein [Prevotellaceae bacterium]
MFFIKKLDLLVYIKMFVWAIFIFYQTDNPNGLNVVVQVKTNAIFPVGKVVW